jgi:hypothetical protein
MEIAEGSYQKRGGHSAGIRGKGYIVKSLEAALWAFWSDDNSFETGVLAAVNLGDDTDTTAAIYGQLAGAYYGYDKLPKEWREAVYAKKFIERLSGWIVYEGERWQPNKSLALNNARSTSQEPSTPTGDKSYKPKQNFDVQPSNLQLNSQQNSKTSFGKDPGSKSVPYTVQDQKHLKLNNNATEPKSSNTAASFQHSSYVQGRSDWDNPSEQHTPSTTSKTTKSQVSNAASSGKYFRF